MTGGGTAAPLPVTVIGGYLGAGKTTLVNHILRERDGRRIAVLVNDVGELSIDDDLIESVDGNVTRLAGGCVCCSFGNDLVAALIDMPLLGLVQAKGLMRDPDGQPCALQVVGQRAAVTVSSHARPEEGRLVCIGLRGQLDRSIVEALVLRLRVNMPTLGQD